ncbi:MAG TPA: type II secretion system protein [Patescibacteria group bacterium]|nr:type II secretion system protein [Patescibacteria group bacterium]
MKRQKNEGFTLIELLIVIGILAVLAITVLLALNPAEAQRKARDTGRLKDVATLQAIVDQYLNDNASTTSLIAGGTVSSNMRSNSRDCATGWLGVNVCGYAQRLPQDPNVNTTRQYTTDAGITSAGIMYYGVATQNGTYKICARQESQSNASKITNTADGGSATNWYEVGSNLTLACP